MQYKVFSDFEIPRAKVKRGHLALDFSTPALDEFWSDVEQRNPGLSDGRGCYLFAVKAGRGIKPWYVGQTKRSFKKECFQHHKIQLYNIAFNKIKKGTPILIFIARCTGGGRLSKRALGASEADFLEKLLMSLAVRKNSELLNKRDTKYLREMKLPGVLNSPTGKQNASVSDLCAALGV